MAEEQVKLTNCGEKDDSHAYHVVDAKTAAYDTLADPSTEAYCLVLKPIAVLF